MSEKIGDFTVRIIIEKVGNDPPLPLMNQLDVIEVFKEEQEEQRRSCCDGVYAEQPPPFYHGETERNNQIILNYSSKSGVKKVLSKLVEYLVIQYLNMDGITSEKEK